MALRSCGRSVRAPDCFSLNMRVAPAALSAAIWSSSVWPSVETRAITDDILHSLDPYFALVFRMKEIRSNGALFNYAEVVTFASEVLTYA